MGENQEIGSKLLGISRRWRLHPEQSKSNLSTFRPHRHKSFQTPQTHEIPHPLPRRRVFIFTSSVIILTSEYSFLTFNKHFAEQYKRNSLISGSKVEILMQCATARRFNLMAWDLGWPWVKDFDLQWRFPRLGCLIKKLLHREPSVNIESF